MNIKIVDKKNAVSIPTLNKVDGKILIHCKAIMINIMTASICNIKGFIEAININAKIRAQKELVLICLPGLFDKIFIMPHKASNKPVDKQASLCIWPTQVIDDGNTTNRLADKNAGYFEKLFTPNISKTIK